MTRASHSPLTPALEAAIAEIEELIFHRYSDAIFEVGEGDDPEGIYLNATVDVADMGDVVDLFLDRLVELQVEEGLPCSLCRCGRSPASSPSCAAVPCDRCRLRCRWGEARFLYRFSPPATAAPTPSAM
jgi:hypothetical protein